MFIIFFNIFTSKFHYILRQTDITAIKYYISLCFFVLHKHCLIIYLEYHKKVYAGMLYSVTIYILDTRSGAKEAMVQLPICVRIMVLLNVFISHVSLKESIGNEVDQQGQEVNEIGVVSEYKTGIITRLRLSSLRLISKRYS